MLSSILASCLVILGAAFAVVAIHARRLAAAAGAAGAELVHLRADLDRFQRLLGQADRLSAIGMLAASVAHEVRNPLVSVRTFAQLLPERLQDEEFRTSFRDLALGEIDRISLLVNDLLAFARPAAPEVHATDINDVLSQIRRLVDGEAKKRTLELSTNFDTGLPLIAADDARVKQVFLNVVLNALHACDPGGRVTVATRTVGVAGATYLQVEVCDSGRGISPSDIDRIFDPFFTTKEDGSGLGLFIAQRIVREHGGFIEVTSAPGSGTTFRVNFPLVTAAATPVGAMADTDADDRPHRSIPHG